MPGRTTDWLPIGDCAEVRPGYPVKARVVDAPRGTHQLIQPSHITPGVAYTYSEADRLRIVPQGKAERYAVQAGDVLFMSRGARNMATLLSDVPERSLPAGSFYVIRAVDGILPAYLAWCLNQPQVQAAIAEIRTGAGTPIVQRGNFAAIPIPIPSLERQQQLARLGELMAKEQHVRGSLVEVTQRYHQALGRTILDTLHENRSGG